MYYTIDRIENGFAVLEDDGEKFTDVKVSDLPEHINEGDILWFDKENNAYTVDKEKTAQVKSDLEARLKKLFKKQK